MVCLVSKSKISRQFSVAVQLGLCLNWLETGATGLSCKLAHIVMAKSKKKKRTITSMYKARGVTEMGGKGLT